ncbi:alpha/beta hydrolase [Telmatocola sphagniphila]|uniref:Alpha/beta hydrolase n=1 Tax=Telmatocola sphagniphila TaxID=1123043 RepID=A0A8E6B8X8_9BACT|nr:alpha/beta hydrolase [Telmatocola sphagniphila]QVL33306.1 alpha/beta hydrolase [Telmatocola sphagniphila]
MSWFGRSKKHWFWRRVYFYGFFLIMFFAFKQFIERKLVFRGDSEMEPIPKERIAESFCETPSGNKIHSWWMPVPNARWHIVIFHGNAGNLSFYGSRMARFAELLKASTMVFDYPGYGLSTGSPDEKSCYESATSVIQDYIQRGLIDPNKLVYLGESLGGGVAVEQSRVVPPRALVLLKTFTSLPAAAKNLYPMLPTFTLMSNRFDNLGKIGQLHVPVILFSGTRDQLVPFQHGQELFEAANNPKKFVALVGSRHNDLIPDLFYAELVSFLDQIR